MNKFNIFTNLPKDLGFFRDERGIIVDLFYHTEINHIAIIESNPGAIRGNHLHKNSVQHIFILDGSLEYWYKNENMMKAESSHCVPGDLVTSPENEVHALKIGDQGCRFMAFTTGKRGGVDYESDTFRVDSIILNL